MKKGILKSLSAGALAVLGAMGIGTTTSQSPPTQKSQQVYKNSPQRSNNNSTQNQFAQNESIKITARQTANRSFGGKNWIYGGITPKDYGMYHVRRGTNKKSNI